MLNLLALVLVAAFAQTDLPAEVCTAALRPEAPRIEISIEITTYEDLDRLMQTLPPAPSRVGPWRDYVRRGFTPDIRGDSLKMLNEYKSTWWAYRDPSTRLTRDAVYSMQFNRRVARDLRARGFIRRILAPRSRRGEFEANGLTYAQALRWSEDQAKNEPPRPHLVLQIIVGGDLELLPAADRAMLADAGRESRAYLAALTSAPALPPLSE